MGGDNRVDWTLKNTKFRVFTVQKTKPHETILHVGKMAHSLKNTKISKNWGYAVFLIDKYRYPAVLRTFLLLGPC